MSPTRLLRTDAGATLAFAVAFVLTALLGRLAVLPDSSLALAWPAAGVAATWLAFRGLRWRLAVDAALLFVVAWAVNDATGTGTGLALGLAEATVLQSLVFGLVLAARCPELWGTAAAPAAGVERLRDLGWVLAAAYGATAVSGLLGPATVLSAGGADWSVLVSWVLRNGTAVAAVFPLALLLRHAAAARATTMPTTPTAPLGRRGWAELALLVVVTAAGCWLVFGTNERLPIPFLVLATSVWAGTRFAPGVAIAHAVLVSAAVVALTREGFGPFPEIASVPTRALVTEAYVAVAVVLTLALSVVRREALVLTGRLRGSEAAAREQAATLRTILDTMADGVTVLDAHGEVRLRNAAAEALVGALPGTDGHLPDGAASGLRDADGSPVGPDRTPVARAFAGEEVERLDYYVDNPAVPGDRMIEVTARPLPDTDPPLAVVVFHDVTADRRERDELASFAGVVAHDLLNPLTVIEGWSEALADGIRSGADVPPERRLEQLDRIGRAAQRMQHLITDLLAYTTARDLRINPVRVDLGVLAREIARARLDAARVKGVPEPLIVVAGELPAVLAEPVLLRQVLDNLVGNAVKYVAPGVRPEIEVSAQRLPDRPLVELRVADNGIGIPEAHRSRVFDSFHRAHRDGYRGTGLGLSIVKRIVERHGGSVAARDRDGGGTVMVATFPVADHA